MVRRHVGQLELTQLVLFGVVRAPEELMDPALRRIDGGKVPDAKTLVRLGQLLGGPVLEGLFRRVVELAIEKKVARGRRMRIDTTVVEAPIRSPTDSGLCADVVRVLSRALRRLVEAGVQLPFALRNVRRSVSRRLREIGDAARRRGERAREALRKPYQGLLRITGRLIRQAQQAVEESRAQQEALGEQEQRCVERMLQQLQAIIPLAQQVTHQTRARVLRGMTRSADKLISLFESWAQILRRGKPHRPTEFGALVLVQESEGGLVTDSTRGSDGFATAEPGAPEARRGLPASSTPSEWPAVATTDRQVFPGRSTGRRSPTTSAP